MKLSFEVLEVLDAIDRTGTFAEAASLLHRVPSALTYLVKKTEADLGVALFDRNGRRAQLTEAGQLLVEDGRRLLRAGQNLESKVRSVHAGWEAELRLCVDEILPLPSLWPYVRAFYELNMTTRLRLSTEVLGGVWDALVTGRADIAIGAAGEPPHAPNIAARPIGLLRHAFVVAPDHPLAVNEKPLDSGAISSHRGVIISDTSRDLEPRSVAIRDGQPVIVVPNLAAKIDLLCEGMAVGMLPAPVAEELIRQGKLVERQVTGVRSHTNCYLGWREDKTGRASRWWIEQLDQVDLISRLFSAGRIAT
ncbi:LysR family transcriptional regulator [Burkholderia cepacia]|uniref:LysR family transcriptional regulator n=1 Tax=Burkholderia cepacia TaxID=292 RepID=UPI000756234B|nr:LysR family transcriptional regulator [Burkholderia cepacia]KVS73486.1 LysR family transcriptional regulator [Burkholderia cepacia]RQT88507.1 LysR family transcriptional regulator [Burkholderia cepacia]RQU08211.1 LysR family transcriptional regulator [Burkholderia cepacia]RQZ82216.1 LysR family transcriptional regulator [Burkholderia cepacia]